MDFLFSLCINLEYAYTIAVLRIVGIGRVRRLSSILYLLFDNILIVFKVAKVVTNERPNITNKWIPITIYNNIYTAHGVCFLDRLENKLVWASGIIENLVFVL